jgi:hypothetical protein
VAVPRWAAGLIRIVARPFTFWAARRRQREEAWLTGLQRRERVINRSRDLLRSCLQTEQLLQFDSLGCFTVRGRLNDYRINQGRTANVDVLSPDGRCLRRLCFYPESAGGGELPAFDVMLAQKLMLECDEERALTIAVAHPILVGLAIAMPMAAEPEGR